MREIQKDQRVSISKGIAGLIAMLAGLGILWWVFRSGKPFESFLFDVLDGEPFPFLTTLALKVAELGTSVGGMVTLGCIGLSAAVLFALAPRSRVLHRAFCWFAALSVVWTVFSWLAWIAPAVNTHPLRRAR